MVMRPLPTRLATPWCVCACYGHGLSCSLTALNLLQDRGASKIETKEEWRERMAETKVAISEVGNLRSKVTRKEAMAMKAKDRTAGTKKGRGASEGSTRPWRFLVYGFTIVGMVLSGLLIAGLVADGLAFDRTQGGNEPPYTDYTGEPIDWGATYVTNEGFFNDGYVLDLYVDCTTWN